MTYALLDDCFYDSPTFAGVDDDLIGVWAKGLAYCNRHLTNGFLTRSVTRSLCTTCDPDTVLERMVTAGLWREKGDRVEHIGYLDHNPSKREVLRRRKAVKDRKDKWKHLHAGTRSATRSHHDPGTPPNPLQSDPLQSNPNINTVTETVNAPAVPPNQVQSTWDSYLTGWQQTIRGHRPPVLNDTRRRQIRARLKVFSVEDLTRACAGLWASTWHVENGQTHPELVFRSDSQVEKFLNRTPSDAADKEVPGVEETLRMLDEQDARLAHAATGLE